MQEGELLTMGGGVLAEIIYFILIINICAVKNVTTGAPAKFVMGASPKMPPPPCRKRDPPTHRRNGPHTFCTHRKNVPIGKKKPPIQFFFMLPDHDLHSFYSVCLRELEKIKKKY